MTPKEKAKELYNKYLNMIEIVTPIDKVSSIPYVKKCALIAVDEILYLQNIISLRRNTHEMELEFWDEVKQEIEKL